MDKKTFKKIDVYVLNKSNKVSSPLYFKTQLYTLVEGDNEEEEEIEQPKKRRKYKHLKEVPKEDKKEAEIEEDKELGYLLL